jgi:hypothetical protein
LSWPGPCRYTAEAGAERQEVQLLIGDLRLVGLDSRVHECAHEGNRLPVPAGPEVRDQRLCHMLRSGASKPLEELGFQISSACPPGDATIVESAAFGCQSVENRRRGYDASAGWL